MTDNKETRHNGGTDQKPAEAAQSAPGMRRIAKALAWSIPQGLGMVLIASALALLVNWVRSDSLPLIRRAPFDIFTDCPEVVDDLPKVTAQRLGPKPKGVVLVDGRKAWNYCSGHIPGAWSLPMYETDPPDAKVVARLRKLRGRWVIVYGDASVAGGKRLASALISAKVRGIHLLEGGLEAWKAKGYPLEKCRIPKVTIRDIDLHDFQLVDARPEEIFSKKHLPGAVSLPFDDVLPPDPNIFARLVKVGKPLLVYDDGEKSDNGIRPAWAVAAQLKTRGARDVSILEPGKVSKPRTDSPQRSTPDGRRGSEVTP